MSRKRTPPSPRPRSDMDERTTRIAEESVQRLRLSPEEVTERQRWEDTPDEAHTFSEQPLTDDELRRRQEELSAQVDQHLAMLRGEGKTQ